jgi:hypothetical protein
MKRLLKILALIFLMGFAFAFLLPPIQELTGLPEKAMPWVFLGIFSPIAWVVVNGIPSFAWISGTSKRKIIFRVIGVFISIVGGVLIFGNRTGLLVTFPFAGFVVLIIGVAIYVTLGDAK